MSLADQSVVMMSYLHALVDVDYLVFATKYARYIVDITPAAMQAEDGEYHFRGQGTVCTESFSHITLTEH